MFSQQKRFLSTMAPFASRDCGPKWFWRKFPPHQPQHEAESKEIWYHFLKPTLLSSRLQSGVKGLGLVAYQTNLVARQFGFTQFLPCPLFLRREDVITLTTSLTEKTYKDHLSKADTKKFGLDFFFFEPTFICTTDFERWWALHYEAKTLSDALLHQYIYDGVNEVVRNPEKKELPSKAFYLNLSHDFQNIFT